MCHVCIDRYHMSSICRNPALALVVDVSHGLIEDGECPELKSWSLSRHRKKVDYMEEEEEKSCLTALGCLFGA